MGRILRYLPIFVPIAVLAGYVIHNELLIFAPSATALIPLAGALGLAVLIASFTSRDGESSWLGGAMLLADQRGHRHLLYHIASVASLTAARKAWMIDRSS